MITLFSKSQPRHDGDSVPRLGEGSIHTVANRTHASHFLFKTLGIPQFGLLLLLVAPQSAAAFASVGPEDFPTLPICSSEHTTAVGFLRAGELSRALPLLQHAYAACPGDYENARDLAAAELESGGTEKARTVIIALLRQRDTAELHELLGRVESAERNYRPAAIQYQMAAGMDPSESNIFDFGTALFHLNYHAAATIFSFGVRKYPASVRLHIALGTSLYALSVPDEGGRQFCEAEDLNPSDPHPMELLAETETIPAALASKVTAMLDALHNKYPRNGLLLFDYIMVKSGRWTSDKYALPPDFEQSLRAALALDPRIPEAWFQLALITKRQKHYGEEVQMLQKAIALDPRKPAYYYHLAFAWRSLGNQDRFRQTLQQFAAVKKESSNLK